jgi:antitoxin CcdA
MPMPPKNQLNLSINSDLLKRAKDLNINLSATLEQALADELKSKQAKLWLEKNKSAIAAYNKSVEENGVFSDGLRSF